MANEIDKAFNILKKDVAKKFNEINYKDDYLLPLKRKSESIANFIRFHCYQEKGCENCNIEKLKRNIYNLYLSEISSKIAKLEIYDRDLSAKVVAAIMEFNEAILIAENENNEENKLKLYEGALKYAYVLKHILLYDLIIVYKKRIKEYQKALLNFNQKGIIVGSDNFENLAKTKFNELKKDLKKAKKQYNGLFIKTKNSYDIDLNNVKEEIGLTEIFDKAQALIDLYEDKDSDNTSNYAKIVSNGYHSTFLRKLIMAGIPFIISVCAIVVWIIKHI